MMPDDMITDTARIEAGDTLVIQRWLPGPAARVWSFLVDEDKRRQWFAAGVMPLVPGTPFDLIWRNDDLSDSGDPRPSGFPEVQKLQSRVIAVVPQKRLVIQWGAGDVQFDLDEKGGRVLLTIRHSGIGAGPVRAEVAGGWHMHLTILVARLEGGSPPSFWSGWKALHDDYARKLGTGEIR